MVKTKSQIGKASRAAGGRFELKVRKDLESKGWIVSKWMNNVSLVPDYKDIKDYIKEKLKSDITGFLIPAKHKFRGPGIPMAIGTGFPDFIIFKELKVFDTIISTEDGADKDLVEDMNKVIKTMTNGWEMYFNTTKPKEVIGVEVKSNGYLDKVEKEKCKWLLKNNIFNKVLIASKGKKRGEIIYNEFGGNKL